MISSCVLGNNCMTTPATPTSIADLERLLEEKRSLLQDLVEKRERLRKEIDDLDTQIQAAASVDGPLTRRAVRKRRLKNDMSLKSAIHSVLTKNKKGLSLADLETAVSETGYKSGSSNFRNVVYQAVYNSADIVRDENSGLYKLQK
eukprot:TRINITY_DN758_c1_g1_i1.p1 TRINITY_DN758_c1_g1~~TRINITY_DN758_c1_g1_i1.p1  ORF type:complete len:146 (-),score=28.08 TRINITY_DN758_c1_g1_i1:92-529(-)